MVRTYIRKTNRASYPKETLKEAVAMIKNGTMTLRGASDHFIIPFCTLRDHVNGRRCLSVGGGGRHTTISFKDEAKLAIALKTMAKWGFGLSRKELMEAVGVYINENKIENYFKNGIPGEDWFLEDKHIHNNT